MTRSTTRRRDTAGPIVCHSDPDTFAVLVETLPELRRIKKEAGGDEPDNG